jgi:alpha/beta superfamily hydrolase
VARRIESHRIAGPAGSLEALLEEPDAREPRLAVLVCHPHPQYGGTMHNKVVYRIARGLRRAGAVVLRFNFRGVGSSEGDYGHMTGELEDARAALAWLRGRYPELPFALAGFSFGARVIAMLGCPLQGAQWLLAAGLPTDNRPSDYLERCSTRKVFIQSSRDQYGPREELEKLVARLPEPKELIWIEAGDHFFEGALDKLEMAVAGVAG